MKKLTRRGLSLLLALFLLAGSVFPAAWAAPAEEVTISCVKDLLDFA